MGVVVRDVVSCRRGGGLRGRVGVPLCVVVVLWWKLFSPLCECGCGGRSRDLHPYCMVEVVGGVISPPGHPPWQVFGGVCVCLCWGLLGAPSVSVYV